MQRASAKPKTSAGMYCLGFLTFVVFALLVTTTVMLSIDGASVYVVVFAATFAGLVGLCFAWMCFCMPTPKQIGGGGGGGGGE